MKQYSTPWAFIANFNYLSHYSVFRLHTHSSTLHTRLFRFSSLIRFEESDLWQVLTLRTVAVSLQSLLLMAMAAFQGGKPDSFHNHSLPPPPAKKISWDTWPLSDGSCNPNCGHKSRIVCKEKYKISKCFILWGGGVAVVKVTTFHRLLLFVQIQFYFFATMLHISKLVLHLDCFFTVSIKITVIKCVYIMHTHIM